MGFSEYHHAAATCLQEVLQVGVRGYNTLCSFNIKNRLCEVVFKNDLGRGDSWEPVEAIIDWYVPGVPKTAQTHKRRVVAINKGSTMAQAVNAVVDEVKRMTDTPQIIVQKYGQNWRAYLNPSKFYEGKTHTEALGELLINNAPNLGIEVSVK